MAIPTNNNAQENQVSESEIAQLEQQLAQSGFFTHTKLSQFAERINENEAFLFGLIDYLVDKTQVSQEELQGYIAKVKEETHQKQEGLHPGIALRVDQTSQEKEAFIPVNCEERLPICKAVCCKLNFALSADEVESGKIKWELGQPYLIRHQQNGYCAHMDGEKKCCSIYQDRPKVCRGYSCANDQRIWKDFDKMELNEEWIKANLTEKKIRLFAASMRPNDPEVKQ